MKLNKLSAIIAISSIFFGASAQEQYLHLYKDRSLIESYKTASIDYMQLDDESGDINLYRNGKCFTVGNYGSEIDSLSVAGEVMASGIYMGVIGFNQALYSKDISSLSNATKSQYTSFISNLTSSNGTLLYYAVDNALETLKTAQLPSDLVNVSVVTFTDGLDQGSVMMNSEYTTNEAYLTAMNAELNDLRIGGLPVTAYSIGLRGNDVTDVEQFQRNLQLLSTESGGAVEVNDISEINEKFNEIAHEVYSASSIHTISLTIPGQSDGTRVRFCFDGVSNAANSSMYIEGTFRLRDRALVDLLYCGITADEGTEIVGVQSGIHITFTFKRVQSETSTPISAGSISQSSYIESTGKWQINSEFNTGSDVAIEETRQSAVIMLVLDCSGSLGSQFSTVKTQANNFIGKLAGYGNDKTGFSYVDLDLAGSRIFADMPYTDMVPVEGGTFSMGATAEQGNDYDSDERPTHKVTLSDFYIGKYEVTQQLWEYVMLYSGPCADGSTMSAYSSDAWLGSNPSSGYGKGDAYPAYYVSYDDIVDVFLPRLNRITGKDFRLPTEAEWEYAARGGQKSQGYKCSGSNTIDDIAWYYDNSGSSTHPVGQKQPNELGLYDMSGNVWEWCSDWYGSYSSSAQTDPTGPTSGHYRVYRGGSWNRYAQYCRVSNRYYNNPEYRYFLGFRLACRQF